MISLAIVLVILLGLVALIDLRFKLIPAIFLTGLIFMTATVQVSYHNVIPLVFGVLAFLFAMILYEGNFIGGVADVKVITIIGLMITSMQPFYVFCLLILLYGLGYKLILRYTLKKESYEEIAFIPCLYVVYITLLITGGIL